MRYGAIILVAVVMGLLLTGCAQSSPPTGYAAYSGAQGQQQQYVGGGCGVAPPEAGDAKDVGEASAAPAA